MIWMHVLRCLTLVLLLATSAAAAEQVRFDRLSAEHGLSQLSGNAIVQDRFGFLWIGTQDGLNRYDGYQLKVFKSDSTDPDSLWDNFITGLWLDSSGDLWIIPNAAGATSEPPTACATTKFSAC